MPQDAYWMLLAKPGARKLAPATQEPASAGNVVLVGQSSFSYMQRRALSHEGYITTQKQTTPIFGQMQYLDSISVK